MEILSVSGLLVFLTGLLAGAVAALKVIAPKTATKADDKALDVLTKVKDVVAPSA